MVCSGVQQPVDVVVLFPVEDVLGYRLARGVVNEGLGQPQVVVVAVPQGPAVGLAQKSWEVVVLPHGHGGFPEYQPVAVRGRNEVGVGRGVVVTVQDLDEDVVSCIVAKAGEIAVVALAQCKILSASHLDGTVA